MTGSGTRRWISAPTCPGTFASSTLNSADEAGRYLLVSSTSTYAAPQRYGYTEDHPLVSLEDEASEEITDETYGALKVRCEEAAHDTFGDCLVIRPTYVVGPLDYSGRFTYWVNRLAAGGEVLAPGPAEEHFQCIDARDLTSWMLTLLETDQAGTYHVAAPFPPMRFGAALEEIAAAVGGPGLRLTWVDRDFLLAREIGGSLLPLWPGANPDGIVEAADPARAFHAGLTVRPLRETAADVLASESTDPARPTIVGTDDPASVGLDRERERELLEEWHSSVSAP
ncbi:MAG: NAD-dependent epimerase/dehydratase family protein [Jatrophihabitantaceae bacterium]